MYQIPPENADINAKFEFYAEFTEMVILYDAKIDKILYLTFAHLEEVDKKC